MKRILLIRHKAYKTYSASIATSRAHLVKISGQYTSSYSDSQAGGHIRSRGPKNQTLQRIMAWERFYLLPSCIVGSWECANIRRSHVKGEDFYIIPTTQQDIAPTGHYYQQHSCWGVYALHSLLQSHTLAGGCHMWFNTDYSEVALHRFPRIFIGLLGQSWMLEQPAILALLSKTPSIAPPSETFLATLWLENRIS